MKTIAICTQVMACLGISAGGAVWASDLFQLPPPGVETRWQSFENHYGEKGAAAKARFGRKGAPCILLEAGQTVTLAQAENVSGIVQRIWITIGKRKPETLRGLVIRMYWDGAEKPAVEAPLGDLFCQPLGRTAVFENAWFDNPEGRSFNMRIPMPFRKGFKITVTNEADEDAGLFFYDVNHTIGDKISDDAGYFHAHFRRENPTRLREDFEILPRVTGRGRFLGCNIGVIVNSKEYGPTWWGEGEVKVYLDGDTEYPTLAGTGTEDYIGTGWGQGRYSHLWHGCTVADEPQYAFYRLHGPDPIYFHKDIRVTIQQIGYSGNNKAMADAMRNSGLEYVTHVGDGTQKFTADEVEKMGAFMFERRDDWCATAYFYLDSPVSNLPPIQPYAERVAGLTMPE